MIKKVCATLVSNSSSVRSVSIARWVVIGAALVVVFSGCPESSVTSDLTPNNEKSDLTVTNASATPPSVVSGGNVMLDARVTNSSQGTTAATTLQWYRSSDATITTADTKVGDPIAVDALAATGVDGAGNSVTTAVPTVTEETTVYYGACVTAVSNESNTGNNCSAAITVTVAVGTGSATIRFTAQPTLGATTATSAAITLTASDEGTLFWALYTEGQGGEAPTDVDVLFNDATNDAKGVVVKNSGANGLGVSANSAKTISISGLAANTVYDFYALLRNAAGNKSEISDTLKVQTVAGSATTWVTVGQSGTVLTSADGSSWSSKTSGISGSVRSVAYAANTWVAVGHDGAIIISTDGETWSSQTSGVSARLAGVAYGGATWIAVGNGATILKSSDATTWAQQSAPSGVSSDLRGIAYDTNTWVAVGFDGTVLTSTDGETWTQRTTALSGKLFEVAYGNNVWVAVGDGAAILTSSDATTWAQRSAPSGLSVDISAVAYASNKWIAVGDGATILTSSDATTWTQQSAPSGLSSSLRGIAYGNSTWVAVGFDGAVLTSTNGETWTQQQSSAPASVRLRGVAYSQ